MKKIAVTLLVILFLLVPIPTFAIASSSGGGTTNSENTVEDKSPSISGEEKLTIYLFYSEECPHCHNERSWLSNYVKENTSIQVEYYERGEHPELVSKVRKALSINNSYIPLTVIGSDYFIGYNEDIQKQIKEAVEAYQRSEEYCDIVSLIQDEKDTKGCRVQNNGIYNLSTYRVLPIIGEVNVREFSLPLIAVLIGFVDGFNPCAMWVLIFLITMMLEMKNRKKMWILGTTFLVSSALIYLLFMVSWLGIASKLSSTWFRYVVGIIAILVAFFHLSKFWKNKNSAVGCQVSSKKNRVGIIQKIEHIVKEKKYTLAILGMIALAFSVNVIELACSAGLPLLFTQILSMNSLTGLEYMLYLGIYIFFFLLDDLIVFIIAMTTLKATGISNKYTKYSQLVGGIIMLLIGILLIVKPAWIMFHF